jgi:thiamine biosynthesis protein ThiS
VIALVVNGKPATAEESVTLLEFLDQRQINPQTIAVERNGVIVRRATYGEVVLQDGDRLEIVRMVGGGT